MRKLFTICVCSLFLNIASLAYAQDDCPAGHVRHPAVSPLDHTYMLAAFKASFRAIKGFEPSCRDGAGVEDCEYYIRQSNHFGVYGDDECHAGWSGYWESWIAVGHGDLSLVQTPARFLPNDAPPTPTPDPTPSPVPEGVLLIEVRALAKEVAQVRLEIANLTSSMDDAHRAINQNVSDGRAENRSFYQAVAEHWKSITAFAAPIVTYATCHYTGKC